MPSIQHAVLSRLIPVLRRNLPTDDLPAMRAALTEANRAADEGPSQDVRRGHEERISNGHGFPVFTLWKTGSSGGARPDRSVVYLHGGAYVRPADARHWKFASRLADSLGAAAVIPAYPLAPEFTVEDSFEDMIAVFEDVAQVSPGGVTLVGDSAGGGYALALAQTLRDRGGAQPDRLVLIAPWVDLTSSTPGTLEAAKRDPWLSYPHLAVYGSFWAGSEDAVGAGRSAGESLVRRPRRTSPGTDVLWHPRLAAARLRGAVRTSRRGRLAAGVRRDARPDPRLPAHCDPRGAPGVRAHPALLP